MFSLGEVGGYNLQQGHGMVCSIQCFISLIYLRDLLSPFLFPCWTYTASSHLSKIYSILFLFSISLHYCILLVPMYLLPLPHQHICISLWRKKSVCSVLISDKEDQHTEARYLYKNPQRGPPRKYKDRERHKINKILEGKDSETDECGKREGYTYFFKSSFAGPDPVNYRQLVQKKGKKLKEVMNVGARGLVFLV